MGASGPVCRLAIQWHVRMFAQALRRLCGMAGPSGLPALCPLHGPAGLLCACGWVLCCTLCLAVTFRAYVPVSSIQQLFRAFQELNIPAVWQGGKNRQLEGIKSNSKKNLFSNQLNAEGGVRRRTKWSVASCMCLPLSTAFRYGDWLYQILNV